MADNLKILKQNLDNAINPSAGIGGILAQDHNNVFTEFINKSGKYTGFSYQSIKESNNNVYPPGRLSWNSNSFNDINEFVITVSKLTQDLNDIGHILDLMNINSIIHFKDFVGRSVILKYINHSQGADDNGNDIYDITVKGVIDNANYTYQVNEKEDCVIDFYLKNQKTRQIACVVRYNKTSDEFYLINDNVHFPLNVTGIGTNDVNGFNFSIYYHQIDKIGSVLATVDEEFARRGLFIGASVGSTGAFFRVYKHGLSKRIGVWSGNWLVPNDSNSLTKPEDYILTWDSNTNRLTISHPTLVFNEDDRVTIVLRSSNPVTQVNYIPQVISSTTAGAVIQFHDKDGVVKSISSNMGCYYVRTGSYQVPNKRIGQGGNFWIIGTMHV